MAEGIQWDDAVFDAEETKAAAERAYPFAEKPTEARDRQTRLYRIAFRAGAAWRAREEAGNGG